MITSRIPAFGFCLAVFVFVAACQTASQQEPTTLKDSVAMHTDSSHFFEHLLVDNRKDPACGMPVSAGIGDTAHYKSHVMGFCSKECKELFQKNPDGLLAAADIKK